MTDIFLKTLNMSIAASWLILAVFLFRLVMKRAPKWLSVLLWGVVALRLTVPLSLKSAMSLLPSNEAIVVSDIRYGAPAVNSGIPALNNAVNPALTESFAPDPGAGVNPLYVWTLAASAIWLAGIAAMLLYALISYVRVRRSVAEGVPCEGNVYLCDRVKSPFILGLVRPRIYLPSHIAGASLGPVIAHEKAHLARRDNWWKPLGFLILSIHWFNPLCWAAYALLSRDIELACDEKVIRQMDVEGKKQYSIALLECSVQRRPVISCPLAFGEVGVRERVKNVLNYKKPAFWVIVAAVAACVAVTVCFATNKTDQEPAKLPSDGAPTLQMDGVSYLAPYTPVSSLPYGYEYAGKLTPEQAGNTGLRGVKYFTYPSRTEDFYTYQECGTLVDLDRVDSTQRQWAYVRWVQEGNDAVGRRLTLDEVVMLSRKGESLTWTDFDRYQGWEIGSGLYIMRYEIDDLFEVLVGGLPEAEPLYIYLQVRNEAGDCADLETDDIPAFIEAHKNDVPQPLVTDSTVGGQTAGETAALSPDQTEAFQTLEKLFLTICGGPTYASDPSAYIQAHPEEFRELVDYSMRTLEYCFAEFLKGGQTDLRGQIMRAALDDIAPESRLWLEAETGQEYFDAWKASALSVRDQHDAEWIEENRPAVYLLLTMMGEI